MVEQAGSNYPAMKPGVKLLWLSALLSGDYQQTTGKLRGLPQDMDPVGGYCCLGVLCDICGSGRWSTRYGVASFNAKADMPPPSVYRETGVSSAAASHLSTMNDEDGKTFEDIAAWIDANL